MTKTETKGKKRPTGQRSLNLDFLNRLVESRIGSNLFYNHHRYMADRMLDRGISDHQFFAWKEHLESLFRGRNHNPRFDYCEHWNYRYKDCNVSDMITFEYNEEILGLMKVHYSVDEHDRSPACIVGILQGNEKAGEDALLSIHNLREKIFEAFLYTTQPLFRSDWKIGLIESHGYKKFRDRFMRKEVCTFSESIPDGSSGYGRDKYWQISPDKIRVRKVMSSEMYEFNIARSPSPFEKLEVNRWRGDEVWRFREVNDLELRREAAEIMAVSGKITSGIYARQLLPYLNPESDGMKAMKKLIERD